MISALQKAYPRLASLFSPSGNNVADAAEPPGAEPAVKEAAGAPSSNVYPTERLEELRSLFAQVSTTPDGAGRKALLGKLYSQARVFRLLCESPGLESVSKIAKAQEHLLKQIADKPSCLTPSTLRTTAASIVLLETLCRPGFQPDLSTNPPPRFLSIDDDPVCRIAVSSALERAFNAPDHAETGEAALMLVEKQAYDIIFLDVEMPGMNGFEVCTKIHQTTLNASTPVVFVTIHADFESRSKASECSGQDLIAKPFLPCELALKALTMLLRRRMQARTAEKSGSKAL